MIKPSPSLEIIPPGTDVTIGSDIHAVVNSVCVGPNRGVSYECIWWDGRTRKTEWLQPRELTTHEPITKESFLGIRFSVAAKP